MPDDTKPNDRQHEEAEELELLRKFYTTAMSAHLKSDVLCDLCDEHRKAWLDAKAFYESIDPNCPNCHGSGKVSTRGPGEPMVFGPGQSCWTCHGTGKKPNFRRRDSASRTEGEKCRDCGKTKPDDANDWFVAALASPRVWLCPECMNKPSDSKGHDKAAGNQVSQKETTAGAASASIAATSIPAAPFSDADVEELSQILLDHFDWEGEKPILKRTWRPAATAALRWFRSRPAKVDAKVMENAVRIESTEGQAALKRMHEAEEAGP